MKKTTMALLWLGASISISEIFTGGLLAPLGFARGMAAIFIGHLIGTGLLVFGGYISFRRGETAMESVAFSLGPWGGKAIALCNVLQLFGWTVVMVVQAGSAVTGMVNAPFSLAALVLSALVLVWALLLGSPAGRLNDAVVGLLALLCLALFYEAAAGPQTSGVFPGTMTMTLGIELSIAMPVSWLPLAGDYASRTKSRTTALAMPFAGYFTGSVAMYGFGLFVALRSGMDIFAFMAASRFRIPACAVAALSTLTTAFLDLYSAGVSSQQLVKTRSPRRPVLVIGLLAAAASVFFPVEQYGDFLTAFLTAIGMVFAPVYGALFLEYLFKRPRFTKAVNAPVLGIALLGMAAYRVFSVREIWIPTLGSLGVVAALYLLWNLCNGGLVWKKN